MYLVDYHVHSRFSDDAREGMEAICQAAVERGLSEIAITDHLDIRASEPYSARLDWVGWEEAIATVREQFAGRLLIRRGVELGQPQLSPADGALFAEQETLDFTIGSIHLLEGEYEMALEDFSQFTPQQGYALYQRYLDSLLVLAEGPWPFDVMGHLTYPLRYMEGELPPLSLERYREDFIRLFELLIGKGRGIELNVSGLRQKIGQSFPPLELLTLYRQQGGEIITLGSDAHVAQHVGSHIPQGIELLRQAGFTAFTTFEGHQPRWHDL